MNQSADNISDSNTFFGKMPVLFLGHGNPMNAIEENEFVGGFRRIASEIPLPRSLLCISAHWETDGTLVTAMEAPRTIHDFSGFPKELYEVQYPAHGNPELAQGVSKNISKTTAGLDYDWGLDHGVWSVIKHMYPEADVPVVQLSLDYNQSPRYHYELAKELSYLRNEGVLIIGSGNIVHNLKLVDWRRLNEIGYGYDWALVAREKMNGYILNGDHDLLIDYRNGGSELNLAIPTPEHFLPLLYILALQEKNEIIKLFNDKPVAGSLTMTSLIVSG